MIQSTFDPDGVLYRLYNEDVHAPGYDVIRFDKETQRLWVQHIRALPLMKTSDGTCYATLEDATQLLRDEGMTHPSIRVMPGYSDVTEANIGMSVSLVYWQEIEHTNSALRSTLLQRINQEDRSSNVIPLSSRK